MTSYFRFFPYLSQEIMDFADCISKKIRLRRSDEVTTQKVAQIAAFAPECFAKLRSHFKISEADFCRSIFESGPYISFQSNSKGAARAGGVFFFTRDGAYMIKTIKVRQIVQVHVCVYLMLHFSKPIIVTPPTHI